MEDKKYKACQSCSLPFDKDPNPETREHEMYCGMCYKDGSFTNPNMTLEEMEEYVFEKAVEHTTYPKFLIRQHVKTIKNLERWKNK